LGDGKKEAERKVKGTSEQGKGMLGFYFDPGRSPNGTVRGKGEIWFLNEKEGGWHSPRDEKDRIRNKTTHPPAPVEKTKRVEDKSSNQGQSNEPFYTLSVTKSCP